MKRCHWLQVQHAAIVACIEKLYAITAHETTPLRAVSTYAALRVALRGVAS